MIDIPRLDPDKPPDILLVLVVVVFLLLVLTAWRAPDDLGPYMTDPKIEETQSLREIPMYGYWALCNLAYQCYSARFRYLDEGDQLEACELSMWTLRAVLNHIFGAGFSVTTQCLPTGGYAPEWWVSKRKRGLRA